MRQTLNGYPVVKFVTHPNGYSTVMVKKDDGEHVVATWWPELGSQWMWGHYAATDADWAEVHARNAKRGRLS